MPGLTALTLELRNAKRAVRTAIRLCGTTHGPAIERLRLTRVCDRLRAWERTEARNDADRALARIELATAQRYTTNYLPAPDKGAGW